MKFFDSIPAAAIITLGAIFSIVLTGCNDAPTNESLHHSSLIYCSEGSPDSFNPQLVSGSGTTLDALSNTLYNVLLSSDPDTQSFVPELATSWQVSEDGLTYIFNLRKNVAFHNTEYFTPTRLFNADDVLFSFNRTLDPNHPYHDINGGNYNKQVSDSTVDITALSPYQVQFKLSQPDSTFLYNLAADYSVILSQEYGAALTQQNNPSQIDNLPIGTGPFMFREYKRDELIRYYRHNRYWKNNNNFQQLVFDITKHGPARMAKLMTHECDISAYPPPHQLPLLDARPDIKVDKAISLNVGFWAFNTTKPPFDQVLVRKALAHAINLDAIISAVFYGYATKADSLLPPTSWGYHRNEQPIQYDPKKARQLLRQAGYGQGFSMNIWATPIRRDYMPNAYKVAELMQSDLDKVGIKVEIVTFDWTTFRKRMRNGEHDSVVIGWSADHADPDSFFSSTLSCNAKSTGTNRALWCNTKFDNLLTSALTTRQTAARKAIYRKAQSIINQQVPLFPLGHSQKFQAYLNNVHGLKVQPYGAISFENARKK
ncbi:MAG: cationic peptide transport system substrate-binding protein [Phenylobacterium sp.]|jgi:cationic peptide transport system substrate-binding protein